MSGLRADISRETVELMDDLTIVQKQVADLIERVLKETKSKCEYKKAHEPKGWTSVKIKKFAPYLTKSICDKFSCIKK